jgi:hypothetical protein
MLNCRLLYLVLLVAALACGPPASPSLTPTATAAPALAGPPAHALPDLLVGRVATTLETGGACDAGSAQLGTRVEVGNVGSGDAGPFVVEVNGLRQTVASGLPAGGTTTLWFPTYSSPAAGVQWQQAATKVLVDAERQVEEGDEENNAALLRVPMPTPVGTCTPAPTGSGR